MNELSRIASEIEITLSLMGSNG